MFLPCKRNVELRVTACALCAVCCIYFYGFSPLLIILTWSWPSISPSLSTGTFPLILRVFALVRPSYPLPFRSLPSLPSLPPFPPLNLLPLRHKIITRKNGKKRLALIIWLIFFIFLQTKPSFCHLFAWSRLPRLDFSTIPVSISVMSLGRLSTYILFRFGGCLMGISFLTHSSNPFRVL